MTVRRQFTHMTDPAEPVPEPISARRQRQALAVPFLSLGFRPFFLFAGIWAALGLPLSILLIEGFVPSSGPIDVIAWHRHEMLFGFFAATITGFILTAIPNWTGRLPVSGMPLLCLALLWVAGRIAVSSVALLGLTTVAVVDIAFLFAVVILVLREIAAGKNWRNLPIALAICLLVIANALQHAEIAGLVTNDAIAGGIGTRLAIATIVLLIALVGGRIVPSFTRNWIAKNNAGPMPAGFTGTDKATLVLTVLALALWIALPETFLTGIGAALAAIANLIRLIRWRGHATLGEPIVWVLHLGYLWLVVGFGLIAVSALTQALAMTAAVHGLTVGAIGTMALAVMSRATLGHTGRALKAGPLLTIAYLLVSCAAIARILSAVSEQAGSLLLHGAAGCWSLAFLLFVIVCGPMLLGCNTAEAD
jgi:uncharacterized protein involved in response to NO